MRVMVTGGLGFIGSHLVRRLLREPDVSVVNIDALTYAGNLANFDDLDLPKSRYVWHRVDIADASSVDKVFEQDPVDAVIHLAAESHVDRSIHSGLPFVHTNVVGTQVLLEAARRFHVGRFVHVSTDEVYGSLHSEGLFTENSPLSPNSPYSASKASSDLLALAAFKTYGQDVVVTRCSNNYGPNQFPEKLIPLWITNGLERKPWPIYGDGLNIRDWLYVTDHVEGLWLAFNRGIAGHVYNLGGRNERTNREVANLLLDLLGLSAEVVQSVSDRLGHDRRYAIDPTKAEHDLGFRPEVSWQDGMARTVRWYETHRTWWESIKSGAYQEFYSRHYDTTGEPLDEG